MYTNVLCIVLLDFKLLTIFNILGKRDDNIYFSFSGLFSPNDCSMLIILLYLQVKDSRCNFS